MPDSANRRPWLARVALILPALGLAASSGGCRSTGGKHPAGFQRPVRAIWVTRWDYRSPADIARIMTNCRQAGFNTVLFQVRGHGTVAYPSRLEPWSEEFGGRDPGFDPLAVACREAHRRGLKLHAWANVMPGWRGKEPPADPRQLYNARPDWFLRDASGRRQPLGWYCSLNPAYPEVRRYLVDVMHEIVSRYPVDGLHLDYIRLPVEHSDAYPPGTQVPDYPRDQRTVDLFRSQTGRLPDQDPELWTRWRCDQVTRLVADIRAMQQRTKPGISLTAAVGADPRKARLAYYQDTLRWIDRGLVDAVFPMNYERDPQDYQRRLAEWSALSRRLPIVYGVMFDQRPGPLVTGQVRQARSYSPHFAAFAYNSIFERLDPHGRPVHDAQSPARAELRRQAVPRVIFTAARP